MLYCTYTSIQYTYVHILFLTKNVYTSNLLTISDSSNYNIHINSWRLSKNSVKASSRIKPASVSTSKNNYTGVIDWYEVLSRDIAYQAGRC